MADETKTPEVPLSEEIPKKKRVLTPLQWENFRKMQAARRSKLDSKPPLPKKPRGRPRAKAEPAPVEPETAVAEPEPERPHQSEISPSMQLDYGLLADHLSERMPWPFPEIGAPPSPRKRPRQQAPAKRKKAPVSRAAETNNTCPTDNEITVHWI